MEPVMRFPITKMNLKRAYLLLREQVIFYRFNDSVFICCIRPDDYQPGIQMMLGFWDGVGKRFRSQQKFKSVTGFGDKQVLYKGMKEAIDDHYIFILAIGPETAIAARELTYMYQSSKAVVCVDIKDPIKAGVVLSHDDIRNNIMCFVDSENHMEDHIDRLLKVQPHVEQIFIPYNPFQEKGQLELDAYTYQRILARHGKSALLLPIAAADNVGQVLQEVIVAQKRPNTIIMPLKDWSIVSRMSDISTLAIAHKVPIYAHDPESVRNFAALGSGQDSYEMGGMVAGRMIPTIEDRKLPITGPTQFFTHPYKTYANIRMMSLQGMQIPAECKEWFKQNVVLV
jgi:ABC-type uncharacterized transport system substrate-binding protein